MRKEKFTPILAEIYCNLYRVLADSKEDDVTYIDLKWWCKHSELGSANFSDKSIMNIECKNRDKTFGSPFVDGGYKDE